MKTVTAPLFNWWEMKGRSNMNTALKYETQYEENLERGIELFNEGRFFEAHEAWEILWLNAEEPEDKQFLQGLIMAAGAFIHYAKRECAGAVTLLEKSRKALESGLNIHPEIRLYDFMQALGALRETFNRCLFDVPLDHLPRIAMFDRPFVQRHVY
jgi:predicted metal-dependent hydrolase